MNLLWLHSASLVIVFHLTKVCYYAVIGLILLKQNFSTVSSFKVYSTTRLSFIGDRCRGCFWKDRSLCLLSSFLVSTRGYRMYDRNVLAISIDEQQSERDIYKDRQKKRKHIMMTSVTLRRVREGKESKILQIPTSVVSFVSTYTRHLTAAVVIILVAATIQAMFEYQLYQKNPKGKLVVPPGATQGEEILDETEDDESTSLSTSASNILLGMKNTVLAAYESTKQKWELNKKDLQKKIHSPKKLATTIGSTTSFTANSLEPLQTQKTNQTCNLVVIGDSLACGVGCVNKWDKVFYEQQLTSNGINTSRTDEKQGEDERYNDGPILPRVLANTLSQRFRCNVRWRSAGVVGGCVDVIQRECMDVIRQEVQSGNPPNVVVVLCGMNDIRTHITRLFQGASSFRISLQKLCEELHREAPDALIVLPALPVMYEKNSKNMLLVFPAALLAECFIRFWDLQKRRLAKTLGPMQAIFISRPDSAYVLSSVSPSSPSLTAADLVHPSDYGYFVWGRFLANSLADKVQNFPCAIIQNA